MTIKKTAQRDDGGPTFSMVWRWILGVMSTVAGAAILGMFGWLWALGNDVTKLISAVENNTKSIEALNTRADHLQEIDTAQTASLATVQVQISNAQSNQAASAISLSERIRAIEQQDRWRQNMQQQQPQPMRRQ